MLRFMQGSPQVSLLTTVIIESYFYFYFQDVLTKTDFELIRSLDIYPPDLKTLYKVLCAAVTPPAESALVGIFYKIGLDLFSHVFR